MEEELPPEEIPMDQVLAEIRQMLTQDSLPEIPVDRETDDREKSNGRSASPQPEKTAAVRNTHSANQPDYFLLTPDMRCDLPSETELSETVQKQTEKVLTKLQKQTPDLTISPALEQWLNENLPAMLERAVAKTLKK